MEGFLGIPRKRLPIAVAMVIVLAAILASLQGRFDQSDVKKGIDGLAAAMREGYTGPVFLQADHDQINANAYAKDPQAEIARLSAIIGEQIAASFFNIDIDASTGTLTIATSEGEKAANPTAQRLFATLAHR